jgi:hypothetical protein
MYFSGKEPLIVAATCPACDSRGLGVTVKLSAERAPSFPEHDVSTIAVADKTRIVDFFIFLFVYTLQ